jgi:UDP-N-acetylmuramoylalanine--D-glutamate ligase
VQERNLSGKRVTVMGLGRFGGGVGVTRWLAGRGAKVTVSDQAPAEDLAASVAKIADLGVTLHLGGHLAADFTECDLLVANPAVPFDSPHLAAARAAKVELTTEINLFIEHCRAPIVGITGSVGKSTTTAMIGEILTRRLPTHVGGNIGKSLLEELPAIAADHCVVLELSSFQLMYLPLLGKSPHVALVTNLTPNHLDRHKDLAEYAEAKKNIFRFQTAADVLILNRDDKEVATWGKEARGKVECFSADGEPFDLIVPGRHNQVNAQAAWAAARQMGVSRAVAAEALAAFTGLKHRLQLVTQRDGVRYFNDSKCTTPGGTIVALEAFAPRSAVVIVGGYDKKVDFAKMCQALAAGAKAVVATGATGEQIARGVEAVRKGDQPIVVRAVQFPAAVHAAIGLAGKGDAVLLSPACASFDQFKNYEERGDLFARLVQE